MRLARHADTPIRPSADTFLPRPGGTRDSSPAIYRRVGQEYDLRPGGTLEVGSWLRHGEEGKAGLIPYAHTVNFSLRRILKFDPGIWQSANRPEILRLPVHRADDGTMSFGVSNS
jgi:hypothetical protein